MTPTEITQSIPLHNDNGTLYRPGWARRLLWQYDRSRIRAPKFKIKEWDYYCILTREHGIAFTVAANGYLGFISVTLFDFRKPAEITKSIMTPFPMGAFKMPVSSEKGNVIFRNKQAVIQFTREKEYRILDISIPDFHANQPLHGKVTLLQPAEDESMVIATPFRKNPRAFYYNQKINNMPAEGEMKFGDQKLAFIPETAFGVLDWGRGVWTYNNTWFWGSASGKIGSDFFGFNIGYGFGDTSAATENMLFFNGKAHKLDRVTFHIPPDDFLKPWQFTSNDGRFEMTFRPILDRHSNTNILLIQSDQHQVFGYFSGKAILDDGNEIVVNDFLGFAEKVKNRW